MAIHGLCRRYAAWTHPVDPVPWAGRPRLFMVHRSAVATKSTQVRIAIGRGTDVGQAFLPDELFAQPQTPAPRRQAGKPDLQSAQRDRWESKRVLEAAGARLACNFLLSRSQSFRFVFQIVKELHARPRRAAPGIVPDSVHLSIY